ncbi:MAG TPA: MiaB/RimO family radical SAM methylthiotransferase [Ktedonobacterales bacterium]
MSVAKGKYHIWTVGCQMNQADSQRVASILEGLGWEESASMDSANLVVLNTCSVREQPEKRAHGQLSLLRHAKEQRDDLLVAMMGCMIGNQRTIDDLKRRYPAVDLFFKVESADILPEFLEERWTPISGEGCVDFADMGAPAELDMDMPLPSLPVLPMPTRRAPNQPMQIMPRPAARDLHYPGAAEHVAQTRGPTAWLPVILGCNKVCSYCIVPSRRGVERSRPMDELLFEARELVNQGARELTLLGQTVEAYGLDLPVGSGDLGDLMTRLSEIERLERIRFMTSYPRHMTDKIIQQMAALPKVCEHVNIPVQHGDDRVLSRMRRGYTIAEYRDLIAKLRAWWPGVALSTDVIVGFCGETNEEFQRLLNLLEEVRFDVVHVAAYSPRPGTLSNKWDDDVSLPVKKERLHAVEAVQERISREINAGYVGRTEEVLIESRQFAGGQWQWRGRDRANKLVFFPATKPDAADSASFGGEREQIAGAIAVAPPLRARVVVKPGDLVQVRIDYSSAWSLRGEPALE